VGNHFTYARAVGEVMRIVQFCVNIMATNDAKKEDKISIVIHIKARKHAK